MDRREFVSGTLAAGGTVLAGSALSAARLQRAKDRLTETLMQSGTVGAGAEPAREYYELRRYHLRRGPKQALMDAHLRDAEIPAITRAGAGPVGVFNVCSGVGVPIGDAVTRALQLLGLDTGVEPGDEPGGPVIGDPGRWREASGLDEELTSVGLAHVIARSVQALSSPTDRNLSRDTRAGA